MFDIIGTSRDLLGRLTNRFQTTKNDVKIDKSKPDGQQNDVTEDNWLYRNKKNILLYGRAVAAGAGVVVVAVPVGLSVAGFGAVGISASSLAACMMSKAATTGFGMGMVSTLQSAGAAGIATSTKLLIGGAVTRVIVASAGDRDVPTQQKLDAATNTETTRAAAIDDDTFLMYMLFI